jgi:hypothetical protein
VKTRSEKAVDLTLLGPARTTTPTMLFQKTFSLRFACERI